MMREHTSNVGMGDRLLGAAKRNPEGLLLLAAGCALLLRSNGSARAGRPWTESRDFARRESWEPTRSSSHSSTTHRAGEGLAQAGEGVREYASELASKASATASSYASSVSSYADETRRAVSEHSERFARETQSAVRDTFDRVLQNQPLAVALVGLAAGAAVAAAFPATKIVKRTLGPAGEWITDAAEKVGEQLKGATEKAGERLVSAAEERGFTSDGVKELAGEVAQEFQGSLSSEQSREQAQPGGQPYQGGSARTTATNRSSEGPSKSESPSKSASTWPEKSG